MESQTKNITKYERVLKVYLPNGAELSYNGKFYKWHDYTMRSIMGLIVASKDKKETHTIWGYFAWREIVRKVEEEKKE